MGFYQRGRVTQLRRLPRAGAMTSDAACGSETCSSWPMRGRGAITGETKQGATLEEARFQKVVVQRGAAGVGTDLRPLRLSQLQV